MTMRDLAAGLLAACICVGPAKRGHHVALAQDAPPAPNPDTFFKLGPDSLMDALSKKGYAVNYAWGMNRHGQAMGGAIRPEMMRWLWRDHPLSTDPRDMTERSMRSPAAAPGGAGGGAPR